MTADEVNMKQKLTQERARELFEYDSRAGELRWRGGRMAGERVGYMSGPGYLQCSADGAHHYVHRVVWLMQMGDPGRSHIDHINGNKLDNRIENLRAVSVSVNQQNRRKAQTNSITGLMGVSSCNPGRYFARIRANGKTRQIGTFATPEAAHAAYLNAKRELHEGCTI